MEFLYEYMTPEELEFEKESMITENESLHLSNELAVIEMEHNARINDIEVQAIVENYTEDDLTGLYTQEMAIYEAEKENWWTKFKAWVKGVVDKILGRRKDVVVEEPEEIVELDVDPKAANNILTKVINALKHPLNFKNEDGSVNWAKVVGEGAIVAGVGAALTLGGKEVFKKVKMKKSEADKSVLELENKTKTAEAILDHEPYNVVKDNGVLAIGKELVTKLTSFVSDISNKVRNKINSKKEEMKSKKAAKDAAKNAKVNKEVNDDIEKLKKQINSLRSEYKKHLKSGDKDKAAKTQAAWKEAEKEIKHKYGVEYAFTIDDIEGDMFNESVESFFEETMVDSVDMKELVALVDSL